MTSWIVVDSNIFLATVLEEDRTPKARTFIQSWNEQGAQFAAPTLFRYEIIAVIRKSVYRKVITPEEGLKGCDILLAEPIHFMINDNLLRRAYELAMRFNQPTAYDAQYLAVAENLGCDFWTGDE